MGLLYSDNRIQIQHDVIKVLGEPPLPLNDIYDVRMELLPLKSQAIWLRIFCIISYAAFILWATLRVMDPTLFYNVSVLLSVIYTFCGSLSLFIWYSISSGGRAYVYGVVLVHKGGKTQIILAGDKLYVRTVTDQIKSLIH